MNSAGSAGMAEMSGKMMQKGQNMEDHKGNMQMAANDSTKKSDDKDENAKADMPMDDDGAMHDGMKQDKKDMPMTAKDTTHSGMKMDMKDMPMKMKGGSG
jgi:hypothetical protein